jgi:hypothetical protein
MEQVFPVLVLVAIGVIWYRLVIWWQVAGGLVLLPLAALSFRKAILQTKHSV